MTGAPQRIDLVSLEPDELETELSEFFRTRGEPAYRVGQVRRWLYEAGSADFDGMTDLPASERTALEERYRICEPELARLSVSEDGTAKHLWQLEDGELVESVLIPARDRLTLCLSSQAGCAVACTFCATGWSGFRRHLTAGEIVAQYRASARWAVERDYGPITNVVYMGMGEPLANRDAVFPSLTILNHGLGVGARRITVSTVGVVPGILELARRPEQFRLAVSLHSPDPALRAELIPLEKRWPLHELMDALRVFDGAGGKRITLEYVMIRSVNDALPLASALADLATTTGAFVNLIPFNPIPNQDWKPSRPDRVEQFRRVLEDRGVAVAVREPRGRDIEAACGQLRTKELVSIGAAPTEKRRE